jgi:tetratricopeptide (TPR) repeat protein
VDDPDFATWMKVVRALNPEDRPVGISGSRDEALSNLHRFPNPVFQATQLLLLVGDARGALPLFRQALTASEQEGQIGRQVFIHAMMSRAMVALGDLPEARSAHLRGVALAARLPGPSTYAQQLIAALAEMRTAVYEEWDQNLALVEALLKQDAPELRWVRAIVYATGAVNFAIAGREEEALAVLSRAVAAMERTPIGDGNLTWVICDAAWALWLLERTDHIEAIERNVRQKVVGPDFRYPMRDGRTALARLCALRSRYDEAEYWFAEARTVLDADGKRPLRAIVDYDEALMYARRNADGDRERALHLLDAAFPQFREIGMTGWIHRGEELQNALVV